MPDQAQVDQLNDVGYFITDDLVDGDMFTELLAASQRAKTKVREGRVDVFTHWATKENTEPWAIRGLLAPEFEEPVFARHLLSKPVMDYAHYFLGPRSTFSKSVAINAPQVIIETVADP